jgi:pimeloyl-ACP methyl ester carboxylesterase
LRETGRATIHANVYENPLHRGVTTILAVHGLTEVGSMYEPLANAVFADPVLGRSVRRIVAIDLPGHGLSGSPTLPSPLKFSDLLIEDNVSVVIQAIDALRARHLGAQVLLGHSMGGLAVQAAQETLLAQGSSLAGHGIFAAVLIAAVPALGSVWTQPPPADLSSFVINDPALGMILDLPPAVAQVAGGYTTLAGTLAADAPSVQTIADNGWVGIEPLTTVLELTGTSAPLIRPAVRQGAFAPRHGTILTVISFSQDVLTPAVDQDDLYLYLTGKSGPRYHTVVADDAVHAMFVSNPTGLLAALREDVH